MALDVIQVEGCYVSSSLPKALFVPAFSSRKRNQSGYSDSSYAKPKGKSTGPKNRSSKAELPPVEGRQHISIQTDEYLEELCDAVEEVDAECETEPYLDRPPSPLFVPSKSGQDAETQVYPGELFDFDEAVKPVIDALVRQTLEQAVNELMEEDELAAIAALRMGFETRRNAELADVKQLEEEEGRLLEEKEKKLKEQEESILLEEEVAQKIVACIFSQNYLSELVPQVYKKLEAEGYFDAEDPDLQELEDNFWPWMMDEVDSEIATLEKSCELLDGLIENNQNNSENTGEDTSGQNASNEIEIPEGLIPSDIEQKLTADSSEPNKNV